MKALIVLALIAAAPFAQAGFQDSLDESGAPMNAGVATSHKGCVEGQTESWELLNGNDGFERVTATCRNGSFATAKKVAHKGCVAGSTERFLVSNGNDGFAYVTYSCKHGKFVRSIRH